MIEYHDGIFQIKSEFDPAGDQPKAINELMTGIRRGRRYQTLLGATGTGKTFTMANTIMQHGRPALIISHNKTLAAQLYEEMRELFPDNAVDYFVSYYDYYQPEAYIPQRDIYIEKDASRNDDLDRLRLAATSDLIGRNDVIIVASVSCLFGLGSPDEYQKRVMSIYVGDEIDRQDFLRALTDMQYQRADYDFKRGTFRVRGDVVELHPAYVEYAYRIELFGDEVDRLEIINPVSGEVIAEEEKFFVYPAVHYVMPEDKMEHAISTIQEELKTQVMALRHEGKLLEAQRLQARTKYDIEMMREVGYCSGIENYSRHLEGRPPGSRPFTLLDYFPEDYLLIIDESHVTVPQMRAMYNGDRNRKLSLVDHGFRLPSALDNRPLKFEELEKIWPNVVFVSATPGPYELEQCEGEVVEQIIRPTGLLDPVVEVRSAQAQVPDIVQETQQRAARGERVLINTLTKRLAEDLASYMADQRLRVRYLHSDIQTIDRVDILKDLRLGEFDALIGVNLLREGLDLPEVTLVCILDADKAGFLRSRTSMIQQIGRAARNADSKVILYADQTTPAMAEAIEETARRREMQMAFNEKHGITPTTIKKAIREGIERELRGHRTAREAANLDEQEFDREELITMLEKEMFTAAEQLDFEKAAALRDQVQELKDMPAGGTAKRKKVSAKAARKKVEPGTPGYRSRRAGGKHKKRNL